MKVKKTYPLWFQYEVGLTDSHPEKRMWSGGLINIIVFAASVEDGKVQCGLHVAHLHLEIKEFKRASGITEEQLENTGPVFKDLYKKAELSGIAARFDGWKTSS